jgi:hypothetical protein
MIGSYIDYDTALRELELEFESSIELKKWRIADHVAIMPN